MTPPAFWQRDGILPRLLAPLAFCVAAATARRVARPGWRAPVPVLCCGNAGVGGAGKTTLALDLAARLRRRGIAVHILSRGYRARARLPLRVDPAIHDAASVGDEPLLLAAAAPTWIGPDRAATARLALADGAQALLLDDGLQNPTLEKTASLLVVDGGVGFGNGRVLPAGPLREPAAAAAARCNAAVLIGPDRTGARALLGPVPLLEAAIAPERDWRGRRVFAFCGIARPSKFSETLREAGAELAGTAPFPDHHRFTRADLADVLAQAHAAGARPVTTAKDAVRLPPDLHAEVDVLAIRLAWRDEAAIERWLDQALDHDRPDWNQSGRESWPQTRRDRHRHSQGDAGLA